MIQLARVVRLIRAPYCFQSFPNQGRQNLGLYDHRFSCIFKAFFTGGASITLAVVFNDFACGRNEFQLPANILLADQYHLRAADWTDLFFFWKRDDYWILFYFCFIKKILLSWNVIGSSYAG